MIAEQIPAVRKISLEEKWLLASELWTEVEQHQDQLPTHPEIAKLVEQRFAEYEADPTTAMTLDEFKLRYRLP